jgi:hypothetical protein
MDSIRKKWLRTLRYLDPSMLLRIGCKFCCTQAEILDVTGFNKDCCGNRYSLGFLGSSCHISAGIAVGLWPSVIVFDFGVTTPGHEAK